MGHGALGAPTTCAQHHSTLGFDTWGDMGAWGNWGLFTSTTFPQHSSHLQGLTLRGQGSEGAGLWGHWGTGAWVHKVRYDDYIIFDSWIIAVAHVQASPKAHVQANPRPYRGGYISNIKHPYGSIYIYIYT